ncbi:OTU-like cysteine protease family protein [Trichonephila clavata]|uniref:OTU-like cysteine protease family protein n=1 Tax=Trichonephila clavata TaxID=2740835 RepID=A0A8X6GW76_TRICU|nr:OTU-like cysteine protease family protein [Trichonephila clavata]
MIIQQTLCVTIGGVNPDVEGRILCEKYGVKLHVIESNPLHAIDTQQDRFLHELIDNSGSKSAGEYNKVDYNDSSIVHIINKDYSHFEPLLDINKSLAKQLQEETKLKQEQEQEDFLLAKKLQLDEILEYCNLSKDISERAEVEKRFDELLAKNADGKICDVVEQCVSDIKAAHRAAKPFKFTKMWYGIDGRTISSTTSTTTCKILIALYIFI